MKKSKNHNQFPHRMNSVVPLVIFYGKIPRDRVIDCLPLKNAEIEYNKTQGKQFNLSEQKRAILKFIEEIDKTLSRVSVDMLVYKECYLTNLPKFLDKN